MKSKKIALMGLASLVVVAAGCSTPTEITTRDGQTVVAPDEPDLNNKDDFIRYDKDGKEVRLHKDEVRKMEEVK